MRFNTAHEFLTYCNNAQFPLTMFYKDMSGTIHKIVILYHPITYREYISDQCKTVDSNEQDHCLVVEFFHPNPNGLITEKVSVNMHFVSDFFWNEKCMGTSSEELRSSKQPIETVSEYDEIVEAVIKILKNTPNASGTTAINLVNAFLADKRAKETK